MFAALHHRMRAQDQLHRPLAVASAEVGIAERADGAGADWAALKHQSALHSSRRVPSGARIFSPGELTEPGADLGADEVEEEEEIEEALDEGGVGLNGRVVTKGCEKPKVVGGEQSDRG